MVIGGHIRGKGFESKLIQLQIIESHRDFNTIYSVKINYRGPNVSICSKPFQPAAAINEIQRFYIYPSRKVIIRPILRLIDLSSISPYDQSRSVTWYRSVVNSVLQDRTTMWGDREHELELQAYNIIITNQSETSRPKFKTIPEILSKSVDLRICRLIHLLFSQFYNRAMYFHQFLLTNFKVHLIRVFLIM